MFLRTGSLTIWSLEINVEIYLRYAYNVIHNSSEETNSILPQSIETLTCLSVYFYRLENPGNRL